MESAKIVLACIVAAVLYGIVHDQITVRICLEYFTVFHPMIFKTQSPTLLALGWGIIATWWAGAEVGLMLTIASRLGLKPAIAARQLLPMIFRLMLAMAVCAVIAGVSGYYFGSSLIDRPFQVTPDRLPRFLAAWWAHIASYGSGFLGGLILCVVVWIKRRTLHPPSFSPIESTAETL